MDLDEIVMRISMHSLSGEILMPLNNSFQITLKVTEWNQCIPQKVDLAYL